MNLNHWTRISTAAGALLLAFPIQAAPPPLAQWTLQTADTTLGLGLGADHRLYRYELKSPVLRPKQVHHLVADLQEAKAITLRVLNGGDGYAYDHAVWGLARFLPEGVKDPL
jgi:hypothetical protein